jgi:UDP-glucuronate decarboxylase
MRRVGGVSRLNGGTRLSHRRIVSTALVTGGAGFLGSHLCDRLISEGKQVICYDNFLTGRLENIKHLLSRDDFRLIRGDVCEPLPDLEVDEVWNLACPASPPRYQADPVHTMMTSVLGTRHCLDVALRNNARFFQASTSEVYGDPLVHPQPESYLGAVNTIGPRACYDEGKRAAEALCFDYARMYGVEIKVVRIFNTYGPRMDPDDGRVVSNFIVNALQDRPLELYGDGQQTRSFCYVDDLIDGFIRLMRSPAEITGPVNIGNPGEFTVRELAEMVLEMTGSRSSLAFTEAKQDDPKQRRPDIQRAKTLLDWSPRVPLHEGLAYTVAHFASALECAPAAEAAIA